MLRAVNPSLILTSKEPGDAVYPWRPPTTSTEDLASELSAPPPGVKLIAEGVKVLVVEDAPSGLRSGKAAGAITLAVLTGQTEDQIKSSGADPHYIVRNLTS